MLSEGKFPIETTSPTTVSSFSTVACCSIRLSALILEIIFESAKRCTQLGVDLVNHAFTLAELFAMSGFHLISTSVIGGLWAAEESVKVIDRLFGSTETSCALASVVMLVRGELFEDETFPLCQTGDRKGLLAAIVKAITAFACLQAVTYQRNLAALKYTLDYRRVIPLEALESIELVVSETPAELHLSRFKPGGTKDPSFFGIEGPHRNVRTPEYLSKASPQEAREFSELKFFDLSSGLRMANHEAVGDLPHFGSVSPCLQTSSPPPFIPSLVGRASSPILSKRFIPQGANLIPLLYRFMRYSTAAYGPHFLRLLGLASWEATESLRHHPNLLSFSNYTRLPIESILHSSYSTLNLTFSSGRRGFLESPTLRPLVHYVTVDHGVRAIVLTCRGTLGISDALTDLMCSYHPVKVGPRAFLAHAGILSTARALADPNSEVHAVICKALEDHPGYGLALCGHSLGGGVAALMGMLWASRTVADGRASFTISPESKLPAGRPIYCFTYGCPSVISYEGSVYLRGLVTSVVNCGDVVPNLSLGILKDLKNVATTLAAEEDLIQQIITRSLGIAKVLGAGAPPLATAAYPAPSPTCPAAAFDDWFWSLIKTMRADMQNEKLYPPGEVYFVNCTPANGARAPPYEVHPEPASLESDVSETSTGTYPSAQYVEVTLKRCEDLKAHFGELNFSRAMFSDHSPRAYEYNLKALVASLPHNGPD
ncbi:hypothetical protein L0F63_000037 [Massospora cicadina]|nr:hypothetical protein L0F63_000037 [Massospora cicadina]